MSSVQRSRPVTATADEAVSVGTGEHAEPASQLVGEVPAQLALVAPRCRPEQGPGSEAGDRRHDEVDEMAVRVDQCRRNRQHIRDAEHHQHRSEDVYDRQHGQRQPWVNRYWTI